jgi:hypothetical protein
LRRVIVLTGDLTARRVDEVKELGGDALIGKPIDFNELVNTFRAVPGGKA